MNKKKSKKSKGDSRLKLRSETVRTLTPKQVDGVVGGITTTTLICRSTGACTPAANRR